MIDKDVESNYLHSAIMSAREIQEFLWGECNEQWTIEEWIRMFRKRVVKIDDIDVNNPHAIIELKKRLLQNAALSIALLALLDRGGPKEDCSIPSNLTQYSNLGDNQQ